MPLEGIIDGLATDARFRERRAFLRPRGQILAYPQIRGDGFGHPDRPLHVVASAQTATGLCARRVRTCTVVSGGLFLLFAR